MIFGDSSRKCRKTEIMFDTEIIFHGSKKPKKTKPRKTPKRLVNLIHVIYKTPVSKIERHLKFYRLDRDSPDVDWGSLSRFIKQVIIYSFRHRHKGNTYADV